MTQEIKYGVIERNSGAFIAINLESLKAARMKARSIAEYNAMPRTAFIAIKYFD